jgi:antitoxin YefM
LIYALTEEAGISDNNIIFVPYWYTKTNNNMIIITSREFREKQKLYLDRVDNGEQIVIQRGKDRSYKLVPVSKEDTLMTEEEFYEKINRSVQQALDGKTRRISDPDEIEKVLGL